MTCNFFSHQHMNPYVNTSCLPNYMPAYQPSCATPYLPTHMPSYASCMPAHMPSYASCIPTHMPMHASCLSHAGNTVVVNTCCPKPEAKKPPLDLTKLAVTVDPSTGILKDPKTGESLKLKAEDCMKIIKKSDNSLEIQDGKLKGGCDSDSQCSSCLEAINRSIADVRKGGDEKVDGKLADDNNPSAYTISGTEYFHPENYEAI